jgi:hypothetical protein
MPMNAQQFNEAVAIAERLIDYVDPHRGMPVSIRSFDDAGIAPEFMFGQFDPMLCLRADMLTADGKPQLVILAAPNRFSDVKDAVSTILHEYGHATQSQRYIRNVAESHPEPKSLAHVVTEKIQARDEREHADKNSGAIVPWTHHCPQWLRQVCHIAFRLWTVPGWNLPPETIVGQVDYGLWPVNFYLNLLDDELSARRNEPLWYVHAEPAPEGFQKFARIDLARATQEIAQTRIDADRVARELAQERSNRLRVEHRAAAANIFEHHI